MAAQGVAAQEVAIQGVAAQGVATREWRHSQSEGQYRDHHPVSPSCRPPDMENCYGYEDMQAYLDQIIPLVEQFFATAYADMPRPPEYLYVPEGVTGPTGCTDGYTDEDYAYSRVDQSIYTGQRALWGYYSDLGDAAPAVGRR